MNNMPLVSIVMCTYNGVAYLAEQLESLVKQTYINIEIIIVDDCSTDNTIDVVSEYQNNYSQISVFTNEYNLGYINNFYKAMHLAKGELIALCDQDDIWSLDKIELMVSNIGDNMLLYHDSDFITQEGGVIGKKMSDVRNFYRGSDSRVFLFENCISGHAMMFKRSLLKYLDSTPKEIMHDWWLSYVALNLGSINYLPQALVQYRQHINASTNILRQDRGEKPKAKSLQKIENRLSITNTFTNYPYNKDQPFKQHLLNLMQERMGSYFSFSLAWFVYKNRDVLLFIQKKSRFSKLNFVIKMVWGYRLKQLFN